MKGFRYSKEMDGWMVSFSKGYVKFNQGDIVNMAQVFNKTFSVDRTPTAVGSRLRLLKTRLKLPIVIEWFGKHRQVKPAGIDLHIENRKVKALIKELNFCFECLLKENIEMRIEMRKLAKLRSAVEQYQKTR
jgi:hypothetical protein